MSVDKLIMLGKLKDHIPPKHYYDRFADVDIVDRYIVRSALGTFIISKYDSILCHTGVCHHDRSGSRDKLIKISMARQTYNLISQDKHSRCLFCTWYDKWRFFRHIIIYDTIEYTKSEHGYDIRIDDLGPTITGKILVEIKGIHIIICGDDVCRVREGGGMDTCKISSVAKVSDYFFCIPKIDYTTCYQKNVMCRHII